MMNWLWSRNPPDLACPRCRKWASKKNLDRALTLTLQDNLTCDRWRCGKTNQKYAWETAGLKKSGAGEKVNQKWKELMDKIRAFNDRSK